MRHSRAAVIATDEIFTREYTIAEHLAGSPQLIELLVDADYNRLAGGTIRSATRIADLQPRAPWLDQVGQRLAQAADQETQPAVRRALLAALLTVEEEL